MFYNIPWITTVSKTTADALYTCISCIAWYSVLYYCCLCVGVAVYHVFTVAKVSQERTDTNNDFPFDFPSNILWDKATDMAALLPYGHISGFMTVGGQLKNYTGLFFSLP